MRPDRVPHSSLDSPSSPLYMSFAICLNFSCYSRTKPYAYYNSLICIFMATFRKPSILFAFNNTLQYICQNTVNVIWLMVIRLLIKVKAILATTSMKQENNVNCKIQTTKMEYDRLENKLSVKP